MTQEELNSLMDSDLESIDEQSNTEEENYEDYDESIKDFRVSATQKWPPPPPTEEHKVVHQLDEVTKETEEKSNQIFDVLEDFSNYSTQTSSQIDDIASDARSILQTFTTLSENFEHINTFKAQIERCNAILDRLKTAKEASENLADQSLMAMDMMQYQDIHRQKIERVINVMRSLSKYMSSLFEGKIEDEKRVGSATYIHGDAHDDTVDSDDIEALIAAFGSKK